MKTALLPMLALLALSSLACNEEEASRRLPGVSGSDVANGEGGSGGEPAETTTTSSSGGGGAGGGDAPIAAQYPAADPPCSGDVAFAASSVVFAFPTPDAVAAELNALTFAESARPMTIVLTGQDGANAQMGVSATAAANGLHAFVPSKEPAFGASTIAHGGFWNESPLPSGYLHLVINGEDKYLALENISVRATTRSGCSTLLATLDAIIPASQSGFDFDPQNGGATLAALVGGENGADQAGWMVRALFTGEATSFDFASL